MVSINPHSSIGELQAGLISGRWTSVDLVELYLLRIDQFRHYNAMIFIKDRELLLSEARSLDKERASLLSTLPVGQSSRKDNKLSSATRLCPVDRKIGILHGIPIIVKDNICTSDMPTTSGALALKDAESGFDAEVVRKLRSAGAIIIGKANLSEFCKFIDIKLPSGWSCLGGQTLNAISGGTYPGGSSSGSACAAALGLAAATIGTETNSSIINPSMRQSVVGFKPSRGLCSNSGIIPTSTTLDSPGPICRSVEDAAAMLEVISGGDTNFTDLDAFSIKGARIGITLNNGSELNEKNGAHIAYHFTDFVFNDLRNLGCEVIHDDVVSDKLLSSSFYEDSKTIAELDKSLNKDFYFIEMCEFKDGIAKILSKFSKIPSGVSDLNSLIKFNNQHPQSLHPLAAAQSLFLESNETGGLDDPNYQSCLDRALSVSEHIIRHIFSSAILDFLITVVTGTEWPVIYILAVLLGCPIISVPLGKYPESNMYYDYSHSSNFYGVGYSLILIGLPGDDHKLLCYAKQIENILKTNQ